MDLDLARNGPPHLLPGGRVLTEIDTEYFLVLGEERPSYVGLNYCPFCGRGAIRGVLEPGKKEAGLTCDACRLNRLLR